MADEFVLFEDGQEVDWFDPVLGIFTTDDAWVVDNGVNAYAIPRKAGRTYEIRPMKERA